MKQAGTSADVEVMPGTRVLLKADRRDGDLQDSQNAELAVRQTLNSEWKSPSACAPTTAPMSYRMPAPCSLQTGSRTDAQLRADYRPDRQGGKPGEKEDWEAYGYVQGTLERDDTRDPNNCVGLGGVLQVSERVKLSGEALQRQHGRGRQAEGADYRISDRSNAYLAYTVETESLDVAWRGRQGTLISGASTRVRPIACVWRRPLGQRRGPAKPDAGLRHRLVAQ